MNAAIALGGVPSVAVRLAPQRPWVARHNYLKAVHGLLPWVRPNVQRQVAHGYRMELDTRDFVQAYISLFGVWEPDISAVIAERLSPGDVALDIGAHVGYDALLMAGCVGKAGQVFAFEPNVQTFGRLTHNLALNGLTQVTAINAAVSDHDGVAPLVETIAGNSGSCSIARGPIGRPAGEARLLRLAEAVPEERLRRVRLIKIDTEGAEGAIVDSLLGLDAFLDARPDLVVEISDLEDFAARGLWERLASLGYRAFVTANDYSREYYAGWKTPAPLTPLHGRPKDMVDILFTAA
jgi:FkbM family methyltransferase